MSTYAWPSTEAFRVMAADFGLRANVTMSTSAFNGETQTVWMPGSRWVTQIMLRPSKLADRAALEAFIARLEGQYHRIQMGHPLRREPRGTLRGSPTLTSSVAQGARALPITGSGTLFAGDMLGVNNQLVMVAADPGSLASVPITPPLRAAATSGTPVVWDAPKALWVLSSNEVRTPIEPVVAPAFAIDLVEVFS
jgi:hypothetical protein